MNKETYLLTDSEMIIEDAELGISIKQPFEAEKHRLFYPDGKLKAEMYYAKGQLHGPSVFFDENNQPLTQTWYLLGKKIGKVKYFYTSGQCASVQRFKDGVPEGMQEYWYEDGSVKSLIPYAHGVLHGEVRLYWPSGIQKRSCHYASGKREGKDQLWNESGLLIDEGEFHQGAPIGIHHHFFADGKVREEFNYHTPIRFDRKEWNAAGKMICEGIYASDLTYTERVFLEPRGAKIRKGFWDGQRLCWK